MAEKKKTTTRKTSAPKKTTTAKTNGKTKKVSQSTTNKKMVSPVKKEDALKAKKTNTTSKKQEVTSKKKTTSNSQKTVPKTSTQTKKKTSSNLKSATHTPSKSSNAKKNTTKNKTQNVKITPKKEIATTLNKEIFKKEEPIKIITGTKTGKKKITKKTTTWKEKVMAFGKNILKKNTKKTPKKTPNPPKKNQENLKIEKAKIKEFNVKRRRLIFFSILCLVLAILLMIPYGKSTYLSGASNKKLEMPKFLKLQEECCSYTAIFSSPRSVWSLKKDMQAILKNYEVLNCDGKTFYYNSSENYTITEYSVKRGILFNEMTLQYGNGNSCDIDTKFKKLDLLPNDFSLEDAKKDGNYVITENKVYNASAYDRFMENVGSGRASTLRIVKTNELGNVLITDLEYTKERKFLVSYDGTRDTTKNNKGIVAYKFEHLMVYDHKLYAYNGDKIDIYNNKPYETYYLFDIA